MREARDTGGERTSHVGVDQRHFGRLVIIFVMHVMNHVQGVHVQLGEPFHHVVITLHHFVVIQILGSNRPVGRSHLLPGLYVDSSVDGV